MGYKSQDTSILIENLLAMGFAKMITRGNHSSLFIRSVRRDDVKSFRTLSPRVEEDESVVSGNRSDVNFGVRHE
jgi:hypothetical protein